MIPILWLPAIALTAGGLLGGVWHPGQRLRGLIAHLVGGLVLGTAAAELMPAVSRNGHPVALVIGFCLGFSLMLIVNRAFDESNQRSKAKASRSAMPLLLPFLIDSYIDGLVVGISDQVTDQGWVIPLAVSLEMGCAALGLSSLLGRRGKRGGNAFAGLLLATVYGMGLITSEKLNTWLQGAAFTAMLAFGTAALIYLVIEEVMKQAHAQGEDDSEVVNLAFFIGVLLVWLLETAAP
ncbi:MAG: hypothetical protein CBC50_02435 [Synechococcus sp. TMED90]|nr:MAG: hypothetical protein CBC50_02435 [Synechococcus sp. TMED90]